MLLAELGTTVWVGAKLWQPLDDNSRENMWFLIQILVIVAWSFVWHGAGIFLTLGAYVNPFPRACAYPDAKMQFCAAGVSLFFLKMSR